MCLSIAIKYPEAVLGQGEHLGFEWNIVHNPFGFRCGYVRVPKGHPWHGKDYDDIECAAHGGLTFAEYDMPCDKGGADDAYWVGFDCMHYMDAPDPALPSERKFDEFSDGIVRTQQYVENECRSLCEQAKRAT